MQRILSLQTLVEPTPTTVEIEWSTLSDSNCSSNSFWSCEP